MKHQQPRTISICKDSSAHDEFPWFVKIDGEWSDTLEIEDYDGITPDELVAALVPAPRPGDVIEVYLRGETDPERVVYVLGKHEENSIQSLEAQVADLRQELKSAQDTLVRLRKALEIADAGN